MNKRQFRIGELAKELKVKKFVIRFWEKEFQLQSDRSGGGQRFYTENDLTTFLHIKDLLYNQKFTIPGAKKQLETLSSNNISPAHKTEIEPPKMPNLETKEIIKEIKVIPKNLLEKINFIKKKLLNLKESLN